MQQNPDIMPRDHRWLIAINRVALCLFVAVTATAAIYGPGLIWLSLTIVGSWAWAVTNAIFTWSVFSSTEALQRVGKLGGTEAMFKTFISSFKDIFTHRPELFRQPPIV